MGLAALGTTATVRQHVRSSANFWGVRANQRSAGFARCRRRAPSAWRDDTAAVAPIRLRLRLACQAPALPPPRGAKLHGGSGAPTGSSYVHRIRRALSAVDGHHLRVGLLPTAAVARPPEVATCPSHRSLLRRRHRRAPSPRGRLLRRQWRGTDVSIALFAFAALSSTGTISEYTAAVARPPEAATSIASRSRRQVINHLRVGRAPVVGSGARRAIADTCPRIEALRCVRLESHPPEAYVSIASTKRSRFPALSSTGTISAWDTSNYGGSGAPMEAATCPSHRLLRLCGAVVDGHHLRVGLSS